jgi:ribosome-interacting GTPase 1
MNTIRSADVVCVVVDLSGSPLEEAETVLGLLASRGVSLRSVPRDQLDTGDPGGQSGLIVANKSDLAAADDLAALQELYGPGLEVLAASALSGDGLDGLIGRLWELLAVIRVYSKQPGKPADYSRPFTLDAGSTVEDLAREIHRELPEKMKSARLWGHARFDGQQVQRTETLRDKDVVEIRE